MPTKTIYISSENFKYLREIEQQTGETPSSYINSLVLSDAGTPSVKQGLSKKTPVKNSEKVTGKKGDGLHTCKQCGALLPFYKGKCKAC